MATAYGARPIADDHKLFLTLAIAMAATIAAGFSFDLAVGRSSFAVPLHVHVHALVFFGWTALYVLQTALIAVRSRGLHRRLGWLGAGWAATVVAVGFYTTAVMVREGRVPFVFTPGFFLIMNALTALCFGGLVAAAIRLRRRTEWHRRLLTCAMATLTGPAFGRLLPLPLLIPYAGQYVFVATLIFPVWGMIADRRLHGRVHAAWWWGTAALAASQLLMILLAAGPLGSAIYTAATAGTPGDAVAPFVYPAFPPGP